MIISEGLSDQEYTLVKKGKCCSLNGFCEEQLGIDVNNPDVTISVQDGYDVDNLGKVFIGVVWEKDAADFWNANTHEDARICSEYPADVVIMNGQDGIYLYDLGENWY